jgi:hypothetical protein
MLTYVSLHAKGDYFYLVISAIFLSASQYCHGRSHQRVQPRAEVFRTHKVTCLQLLAILSRYPAYRRRRLLICLH